MSIFSNIDNASSKNLKKDLNEVDYVTPESSSR